MRPGSCTCVANAADGSPVRATRSHKALFRADEAMCDAREVWKLSMQRARQVLERKEEGCAAKVATPHYQLDTCIQYADGSTRRKLERFEIRKTLVAEAGHDIDLRRQAGREHAMWVQRALGGCVEGTGDERYGRSAAVKAVSRETMRQGAELMHAAIAQGAKLAKTVADTARKARLLKRVLQLWAQLVRRPAAGRTRSGG